MKYESGTYLKAEFHFHGIRKGTVVPKLVANSSQKVVLVGQL